MRDKRDVEFGLELQPVEEPPRAVELEPDPYQGRSLLTEMMKIERTERRSSPSAETEGIDPSTPTGAEVLSADYEEQVGLAVECAFEKFVETGNRVTELYGGVFCIARAPKFYV